MPAAKVGVAEGNAPTDSVAAGDRAAIAEKDKVDEVDSDDPGGRDAATYSDMVPAADTEGVANCDASVDLEVEPDREATAEPKTVDATDADDPSASDCVEEVSALASLPVKVAETIP